MTFQLNVVFHGLWGFETTDTEILAHTVKDDMHVYKAGDYKPGDPDSPKIPLGEGKQYDLKVDKGYEKAFKLSHNVLLWNKRENNFDDRHCVVRLPHAKEIKSVRLAEAPYQPFLGRDGSQLHAENAALAQVFIYDTSGASLWEDGTDLKWIPDVDRKYDAADLHFFSQPVSEDAKCFHVIRAYNNLAKLFKLEIIPVTALWAEPTDPGIKGLTKYDTLELREKPEDFGPSMLGSSGSNCDSLVIHNHTH